jgi:hypothetical protein
MKLRHGWGTQRILAREAAQIAQGLKPTLFE